MEFLWQEGHTMHETPEEGIAETERMLNVYADFCENSLAIPVVRGQKTDSEKFAGAEATYTIEALMHDGKALQSGTSHYFGSDFAKAFDVQFTGRDNQLHTPYETSWGLSTRIIGAIIMTHGDNNGLVLPPAVAPIQVVIVPAAQHKPGVLEAANAVRERLAKFCRVKLDDSDNSAGWKFAEYEMKGVPLRLEIGPRDIAQNQCVLVRRDSREKLSVSLDDLESEVPKALEAVRSALYQKALANREHRTFTAMSMEELIELANTKSGFIKTMWCGDSECETKIEQAAGVTSRCMPFHQEHLADTCVCCGKPAEKMIYWGKAY
jgi:prolyl-tRNA synthetase